MNSDCRDCSSSVTPRRRSGAGRASGSSASSAVAASRASTIVSSSRSTRRLLQAGAEARLRAAEHVALAALLEVDPAELEAVGGARPPRRAARGPGVPASAWVTSRHRPGQAAAADAAAQLVELGDAEPVGVEQHHRGRVGDVDADLDHGGRRPARRSRPRRRRASRGPSRRAAAGRGAGRAAARRAARPRSSLDDLLGGAQRTRRPATGSPSSSRSARRSRPARARRR